MQSKTFSTWFNALVTYLNSNKERRLVVLSGNESWAKSLLDEIGLNQNLNNNEHSLNKDETNNIAVTKSAKNCWLTYGDSEIFSSNVQTKRYQDKLGSESDFIVFADSQFTIDALAALSGTLKAGGILFFISPLLKQQVNNSAFAERFFTLLNDYPEHYIIEQSDVGFPNIPPFDKAQLPIESLPACSSKLDNKQYATQGQSDAVTLIKKVLTGHRKRPFVLTADRGRGKSTALAIACAELLLSHPKESLAIIITAPDSGSLAVFFQHLSKMLPDASFINNKLSHSNGRVEFVAIDKLLEKKPTASLVLVDEAAGIPVYLLEQLLSQYHRMVFSSTVHGYEGAGRGFTFKFQKTLAIKCPQWRNLHIDEPIRWRKNDPLEKLIFQGCLLNSELTVLNDTCSKVNISTSVVEQVTVAELINNEMLLANVFSILITAHYQTKPSDLKLLLDNPNIQLMCLFSSTSTSNAEENDRELLGVALLIKEGSWADTEVTVQEIQAVASSKRRLSNHFLPQSLFVHCGIEDAFSYRYLRIMRIAIHPQLQQKGLGSVFIEKLKADAIMQNVDFIGTSFGANPSLLSFWFKLGFATARIGFTQDKASGEHSALLLNSLTKKAHKIKTLLTSTFYRSFDYLLLEEYKTLSTELVLLVLSQHNLVNDSVKESVENSIKDTGKDSVQEIEPVKLLNERDLNALQEFSAGQRVYSSCVYSLYLWFKSFLLSEKANIKTKKYLNDELDLKEKKGTDDQKMLLVFTCRLMQKRSIDYVCNQYGFTGKKMLNKAMMEFVKKHQS